MTRLPSWVSGKLPIYETRQRARKPVTQDEAVCIFQNDCTDSAAKL